MPARLAEQLLPTEDDTAPPAAQPKSAEQLKQEKKSLILSFISIIISIPALIGA